MAAPEHIPQYTWLIFDQYAPEFCRYEEAELQEAAEYILDYPDSYQDILNLAAYMRDFSLGSCERINDKKIVKVEWF